MGQVPRDLALSGAAAEWVGDAQRDHAVTLLGGHCAAGRLTLDEFSERVGVAFAARTRGELEATLADLPSSTFWECLGTYRDELEDPGFASGLVEEGGTTDEMAEPVGSPPLVGG